MAVTPEYEGLRLLGDEDRIFAGKTYPKPFEFNRDVARVFDDMVHRSIPLYSQVTEYVAEWSRFYYQDDTFLYDIGCSTGTTIELISRRLGRRGRFVGVDNSEAMIERAEAKLAGCRERHEVRLLCQDALATSFERASVVVSNYTLQFLPLAQRRQLLDRIFKGLLPGGLLFVSEKIRSACPEFEETATGIYEQFKERHGYSRTEIARKKEALENVLVPLTEEQQKNLILSAGFSHCESVIKWNNFVSLVAFKDANHAGSRD